MKSLSEVIDELVGLRHRLKENRTAEGLRDDVLASGLSDLAAHVRKLREDVRGLRQEADLASERMTSVEMLHVYDHPPPDDAARRNAAQKLRYWVERACKDMRECQWEADADDLSESLTDVQRLFPEFAEKEEK